MPVSYDSRNAIEHALEMEIRLLDLQIKKLKKFKSATLRFLDIWESESYEKIHENAYKLREMAKGLK